jgi:XTP/dITP diphosphohydrolase
MTKAVALTPARANETNVRLLNMDGTSDGTDAVRRRIILTSPVADADITTRAGPLRMLLLASTNPGKLREIRHVLAGAAVSLATLADQAPIPEPEEAGLTFEANAALKARYYAAATGLTTVAEDSGLAIDALGGRPGVLSARYPGATYADKFAGLYRELAPHARPWTARFVCALAVAKAGGGPLLFTCSGTVEGEIAAAPRGSNGFGYDPIFFYPPYNRTLGEAIDEEKLAVSHRGQEFGLLRRWLVRQQHREPRDGQERR